jgi:uncharacterized protein (DUF1810 family)
VSPDRSLDRFVVAQERDRTYERALAELREGRKRTHWMWFVFPQLAGLGQSATARAFAIGSLAEAADYLREPLLGARLRECADAIAAHEGASASEILGVLDAMKLRSSMTLFALAAEDPTPFEAVLARYFAGELDPVTLELLGRGTAAGPDGFASSSQREVTEREPPPRKL